MLLTASTGKVEEEWLTLTEKELKLIERLFENVKNYVNLSGIGSNLCPEKGKLLYSNRGEEVTTWFIAS